jgi:hypothetical protein
VLQLRERVGLAVRVLDLVLMVCVHGHHSRGGMCACRRTLASMAPDALCAGQML